MRTERRVGFSRFSSASTIYVVVLDEPNLDPSKSGTSLLRNFGSGPLPESIYIESNPDEIALPIQFIYQQIGNAELIGGAPPNQNFEIDYRAIPVPIPRSLRQVLEKVNEGSLVQYSLPKKGVLTIPRGRRTDLLMYLGFRAK